MLATKYRRTGCLFALLALSLSAGCGAFGGPKTYPVRGKVTYKGKPVPNGTITFISSTGQAATGELQPDGSYQMTTFRKNDGAVKGEHKVMIVAMEDTTSRLPEERKALPEAIIPEKYTSVATTDLKAEVKEQENTIDFTLTEAKKR